ncbi:MAG: TonB family protein [Spongiibacteraceae bacterium]|jgi:protein TonB|nr:TonB family protein [Spongiibacteraceae bacterium]
MNLGRLIISAALAFVVTALLFILMPALIETADKSLDERPRTKLADIFMPQTEIETRVDEVKPEKPAEPDQPPPDLVQPDLSNPDIDTTNMVNISPGQQRVDVNIDSSGMASSDGEYLPIVKVAPIYPRRAQSRGVEGYCIVEYTVTTSGAIRDPRPVDCQPQGYFENASVQAAMKFKYRPRVVDGNPIEVAGVQNKFTYSLEQ